MNNGKIKSEGSELIEIESYLNEKYREESSTDILKQTFRKGNK